MTPLLEIPGTTLPHWAEDLRAERGYFVDDLTIEDYHGARALLSKSSIDLSKRSLFQLRHAIDTDVAIQEGRASKIEEKDVEALVTGNAFHCFMLEPLWFARRYFVLPDLGDMRSSKNRALRDGYIGENAQGRTPLLKRQMQQIQAMRESCFRIPKLRLILEEGQPEVTAIARDPGTGLPRKARADWVAARLRILMDFKTARDGSRAAWKVEAGRRGYHVQDPWYRDVFRLADFEADEFVFAVVEKTAPYDVGLYALEPESLYAGEITYQHELRRIMRAVETGHWPGYTDGVEMIGVNRGIVKDAEALEQNP